MCTFGGIPFPSYRFVFPFALSLAQCRLLVNDIKMLKYKKSRENKFWLIFVKHLLGKGFAEKLFFGASCYRRAFRPREYEYPDWMIWNLCMCIFVWKKVRSSRWRCRFGCWWSYWCKWLFNAMVEFPIDGVTHFHPGQVICSGMIMKYTLICRSLGNIYPLSDVASLKETSADGIPKI